MKIGYVEDENFHIAM